MREDRCLLLYTKPAVPGRVKTRLIGELSPEQAAALHAAFLGDVVERLAGGAFRLRLAWALEEGEEPPFEEPPGMRQEGADLGERLYRGLAAAGEECPLVAALGSDHPTVATATVEEAFRLLEEGAQVVLGPATDGGYYLVAARAECLAPELFTGVPWSTEEVLSTTLERCRALGLAVRLLAPGRDVDTPEDLAHLAQSLAEGGPACPRTRELLARWGRIPEAAVVGAGGTGRGDGP